MACALERCEAGPRQCWSGLCVQKKESLRENKFQTWELTGSNAFAVFVMAVAFPLGAYTLQMRELVRVWLGVG